MKHTKIYLLAPILLLWMQGYAQDLHYSQFYLHSIHLTPAATGIFEGDFRAAGLYRSQWKTVPVDYRSYAGSVEWKAFRRGTNMLAAGLLVQQDKAGDGGMRWTQLGFTVAAVHALGEKQAISAGFGLNAVQRSVNFDGLRFKNQWTGDLFNAALPSREPVASNGMRPSLSAGLSWLYQPSGGRTRLSAGLGAQHLNGPVVGVLETSDFRVPVRYTGQVQAQLPAGASLDLVAFGAVQQMASARETLLGGGVRQILSRGPGSALAVQFSLATRLGDALIPAVQFEWNNWTLGMSYDWNTSGFDTATRGRGGIEIAVIYRTLAVPALKTFKTCPIF
jgi:type IX secretion system PorP/SprF family membrane protein